ncbi:hypothetical protein BHE74_00003612 [Ensete ventricosum]|nr:hypothetical protein BHE74_00003612 [Ensete ventricosum]
MRSPVRDVIMQRYDQELLGATSVYNTTTTRAMNSRSECHGTAEAGLPCVHRILHQMKALVISIWGLLTGEFDCSSAYIRLRDPDKSEDLAKHETFVESLISCSHGGRALIVKRENTKANSKYQDKTEGQRLRNFIRSVSTSFSSR